MSIVSTHSEIPFNITPLPRPARTTRERSLVVQRASEVTPENVQWLWPGRIAIGNLTLIGGSPGLGKSLLTAYLAATTSVGGSWPCGEGQAPAGSTILLSAEDGVAETVVPRLLAAGADTNRVHVVSAIRHGIERKIFNLKGDLDLLEGKLQELGDVRLVVIDPISAYMGGADGNANVETRQLLEPLSELVNRCGVAVVCVTHLNKGSSAVRQTALHRFVGSIAFAAAARAAFMVVHDAENEENRLFLQVKNNLGPQCNGLSFRLEQHELRPGLTTSRVLWGEEYVAQSADDALAAGEGHTGNDSSKAAAISFLRTILADGPMLVLDVQRHAIEAGLLQEGKLLAQSKPFRSARKALKIDHKRETGVGGRWILELPQHDKITSSNNGTPMLNAETSENASASASLLPTSPLNESRVDHASD